MTQPIETQSGLPALSRRHTLGLLLAGLTVSGLARTVQAQPGMAATALSAARGAPSFTRTAVLHDALLLLASDEDVIGEWQAMLMPLPAGKVFEFAYAYGVASLGEDPRTTLDVIEEVRGGWADRGEPFMDIQRHRRGMMERRLQVAIAWAANRGAADTLFAPTAGIADAALALDGEFLRALSGGAPVSHARAERILRLLYERAFIAMHTIEPDLDGLRELDISSMHEVDDPRQSDVNRYVDAYADWVERLDSECRRLADAMAATPPASLPNGLSFHAPRDPIIRAATHLRVGLGTQHAPGRWREGAGESLYARAVSNAYGHARLVLEAARGDRPTHEVAATLAN